MPRCADLPLFSRSTLRTLALRKEEAVAEAKQCIMTDCSTPR